MQEEFLRAKAPVPPTMADVVRYLRQAGDVVVHSGDDYTVNYRTMLTAEELVERANRKRRERHQQEFRVEPVGRIAPREVAAGMVARIVPVGDAAETCTVRESISLPSPHQGSAGTATDDPHATEPGATHSDAAAD